MEEAWLSNTHIPISEIGTYQLKDMEHSTGKQWYTKYFRLCTVLKGPNYYASNGDRSPYRMAHLFGGNFTDYNHHIIFQIPTCPYKCPYCYVDRLENDIQYTPIEIVNEFISLRNHINQLFQYKVNVLHMMGGDPAIYAKFWPELRRELDDNGLKDIILYSDCLMVEDKLYGVQPWKYIDLDHFILVCNLHGSNKFRMRSSTGGYNTFMETLLESGHYINYENVYYTVIDYESNDLPVMYGLFTKEKVDLLNIVHYEVTRRRLEGYIE